MRNNRKRRPTHPGEILREDVLPAAGLTQDKLARLLGVSRRTVSEILHERQPVTTDMAHRLARAFGTSPEMCSGPESACLSSTACRTMKRTVNVSDLNR